MSTYRLQKALGKSGLAWAALGLAVVLCLAQAGCTRDEVAAAAATLAVELEATLEPWGATTVANVKALSTNVPAVIATSKAVSPATSTPGDDLTPEGVALAEAIATQPEALSPPTDSPTTRPSATAALLPTAVPTEVPTTVPTIVPTAVATSTPTHTPSSTPTTTPASTVTATRTPVPDRVEVNGGAMILIPGGFFQMGAAADDLVAECALFREGCQSEWFRASEPVHSVLLSRYYMDTHEVTNDAFAEYLTQSGNDCGGQLCLEPEQSQLALENGTWHSPEESANHPVIGVTWYGAAAFCLWREARLPTEAEWEKAAAWDEDEAVARRYPWGNDFDGQALNFCDATCDQPQANADYDDTFMGTAPVASFPMGRSAYGLFDMAGNVWEWVGDWYDPGYYEVAAKANPTGPETGEERTVRGGSWFDTGNFTAAAIRFPSSPDNADKTIGFRCAADLP